jgi:hypothetical protein
VRSSERVALPVRGMVWSEYAGLRRQLEYDKNVPRRDQPTGGAAWGRSYRVNGGAGAAHLVELHEDDGGQDFFFFERD